MKKRPEKEIMSDFGDLCCSLSPENLSCDGEISPSAAQMRYMTLMAQWHKLENELGRKVSESEVYKYEENLRKKKTVLDISGW